MLFDDASKLSEELRELFRERYTKAALMQVLTTVLKKYPQLKSTPFQVAINEFIVLHAEEDCEILIDDGDIREMWNQ